MMHTRLRWYLVALQFVGVGIMVLGNILTFTAGFPPFSATWTTGFIIWSGSLLAFCYFFIVDRKELKAIKAELEYIGSHAKTATGDELKELEGRLRRLEGRLKDGKG